MSIVIKSGASGNLLTIDGTAGAARATLYDVGGTVISNVTQGSSLFTGSAVTQNEFTSTNNSSTANVASAGSFTGTSDAVVGRDAIQVNFFADQQCTIQVQQAQENPGTNWNIVDSYVVAASTGDSRIFKATAGSVRVIVTNNGGSTTTAFRLQTTLTPIASALPRSLSTLGNLKVALAEVAPSRSTYTASAANITPPATPTDMVTLTGSATRTIRVLSVELSTTQTTAGLNTFFLVKRSAANTGGTSAALTIVPLDSNNIVATATPLSYSANPTGLGSAVGNVRATKLLSQIPTGLNNSVYVWNFDSPGSQPVYLRGTAQVLALNFNSVALPAGLSVNCTFTWTEEF